MYELVPGNLVVVKPIDGEEIEAHVVLEDQGNNRFLLGDATDVCAHLPLGVYEYDPEFGTLTEFDFSASTLSDAEVFEILYVVDEHDPDVLQRYEVYTTLVEMAAPYEAEPGDRKLVTDLYPEVVDLLENLNYDPLGLIDATALYKAAEILINENIENVRHREIMMGIFLDIYADEFGPQMFEEEPPEEGCYRLSFVAGEGGMSKTDVVLALLEAVTLVLESEGDGPVESFDAETFYLAPEDPEPETVGDLVALEEGAEVSVAESDDSDAAEVVEDDAASADA